MKVEELEAKVISLGKKLRDYETLQKEVRTLKDIEAIQKLQRCYGYYIEHGMGEEIADLFADNPGVTFFHVSFGSTLGKKGIRKFFETFSISGKNPEYLHQVMQLSPIITIAEDGKTAKGRWYGLGIVANPHGPGVKETNMGVVYENEYIKENGVWKIQILRVYIVYYYNPAAGIVEPDRVKVAEEPKMVAPLEGSGATGPMDFIPDNTDSWYPSGYIIPFHFKHPVTGKETSDKARNSALPASNRRLRPI